MNKEERKILKYVSDLNRKFKLSKELFLRQCLWILDPFNSPENIEEVFQLLHYRESLKIRKDISASYNFSTVRWSDGTIVSGSFPNLIDIFNYIEIKHPDARPLTIWESVKLPIDFYEDCNIMAMRGLRRRHAYECDLNAIFDFRDLENPRVVYDLIRPEGAGGVEGKEKTIDKTLFKNFFHRGFVKSLETLAETSSGVPIQLPKELTNEQTDMQWVGVAGGLKRGYISALSIGDWVELDKSQTVTCFRPLHNIFYFRVTKDSYPLTISDND